MIRLVATLLALSTSFTFAPARTWNIEPDGSGDAPTIKAGIDSAAVGDTVLLHDGTYVGAGNKNLDFGGKDLVLTSVNGPEETTIDAEQAGRVFLFENGESRAALLEGVTVRNGMAIGGGGIRCDGSSPTIRDCVIEGNTSTFNGGGGLNCVWGSAALVSDCRIVGNVGHGGGGGIDLHKSPNTSIEGCVISGNLATGNPGGGIYVYGSSAHFQISDCLISGNSAGGVHVMGEFDSGFAVTFENCTITGNNWEGACGGLSIDDNGAAIDLYIMNSILWGNGGSESQHELEFYSELGYGEIACTDIDTTGIMILWPGLIDDSCISEDPLFCDPMIPAEAPTTAGDYTLDAASPCLNAPGCGQIGAYGQGCDVYTTVTDAGSLPVRPLGLFVSPNPSTGEVTLRYTLPSTAPPSIRIYDIRGRVVRFLETSGGGILTWDGRGASGERVAPGIYFVRIAAGSAAESRRVTLVR